MVMMKKAPSKKKAPAKKTKRATPKFKVKVQADGKAEVELSFSSAEAREEAMDRLQNALGVPSKGLSHAIETSDGQFRYCTVNSMSL